jgi:hypothetical protein
MGPTWIKSKACLDLCAHPSELLLLFSSRFKPGGCQTRLARSHRAKMPSRGCVLLAESRAFPEGIM